MERKRPKNLLAKTALFALSWIFWIMFMFFAVNDENSGTRYEFLVSIGFALGLMSLAIAILLSFKFPDAALAVLAAGFAVYLLVGMLFHFVIKRKFGGLYRWY